MKQFFTYIPERVQSLFEGLPEGQMWILFPRIEEYLRFIIKPGNRGVIHGDVHIEDIVEIGEGTTIEHGAVIKGPTIIGKNCEIRSGAYIRGSVITGDNCVIGHTTELIRSILFDGVRLDHFNYVGDSVLGNNVHFGAGAKVANLRFDEAKIVIDGKDTELKKFGVILGDRCQLGVNTAVGPGIIFEKDVWFLSSYRVTSGVYGREEIKNLVQPYTNL
ncbi:glucose-1-phosphate thymidylyltransferase [Candidatus Uhrbacteria bacterium]|nr:glucose-1-phosphate thymidylyltransferase [Candidatus Uhrbacteria bacterium]